MIVECWDLGGREATRQGMKRGQKRCPIKGGAREKSVTRTGRVLIKQDQKHLKQESELRFNEFGLNVWEGDFQTRAFL